MSRCRAWIRLKTGWVPRPVRRAIIVVIGGTLLLLAIAGMVLPILPGVIFLPLALAILAVEFAWAALDCPAGWAAGWFASRVGTPAGPAVLGRMTARLYEPVPADEARILVGWLIGRSGRKLDAASALFSRSGTLLGLSRQTWITVADGVTR